MNSMVVLFLRWMSISSSVTAACTDTSSADTGSSATTTLALPAKARATPMRCFWPPESWRGMRCSKARGSLTRSSSSSIRCAPLGDCLADAELLQRADDLRADRMARVQRVERVLEHHLDRRDGLHVARLDAGRLDLLVAERHRAARSPSPGRAAPWRGSTCRSRTRRRSPPSRLARLEADRLVGLDRARLAAAEDLVGGDLVVFLAGRRSSSTGAPGLTGSFVSSAPSRQRRPVDLVEAHAAAEMAVVARRPAIIGISAALQQALDEMVAARPEIAALRPLVRQRQLAGNGDQRARVLVGAGQRDRAEQPLRIGVAHAVEDVADRCPSRPPRPNT